MMDGMKLILKQPVINYMEALNMNHLNMDMLVIINNSGQIKLPVQDRKQELKTVLITNGDNTIVVQLLNVYNYIVQLVVLIKIEEEQYKIQKVE